MSCHRIAAGALTALVLIPASPALGAAPWSPPSTVVSGTPALDEPTIAFSGNGHALLSARLTDTAAQFPNTGTSRLFGQQPDGSFVASGPLVLAAAPVPFGRGQVGLLRLPLARGARVFGAPPTSLGASLGSSGGTSPVAAGTYNRLTKRADGDSGAITASERGDVAAVWIEHLVGRDHLVVSIRRPNKTAFGSPTVIAGTGSMSAVSASYSAGGDLLVAYQSVSRPDLADLRVEARFQRVGHAWGTLQRLGPARGLTQISTASTPSGRMVVAWGTQDSGEGAHSRRIVRVARRDPGPHNFAAAQLLDAGDGIDRPAGRVAAAIEPDGTATVAWSAVTGRSFPFTHPARVVTAASSQRFGPAQTLAADAAVSDVAMSDQGTALVAWATLPDAGDNQTTDQVFASIRSSGSATFAAPEEVGPPERATLVRAAFNASTGRPSVVWINRVAGVTQTLRFSTRG